MKPRNNDKPLGTPSPTQAAPAPPASSADLVIESRSPRQTEKLGRLLADLLPVGSVVALRGELASGKTCLVRGMATRFADNENVSSPTFTLVNQYGHAPTLYHVDLYRLAGPEELADLGYEDLFEPDGICVVEWAERAEPLLPAKRLDILLEHVGPGQANTRRITLTNRGLLSPDWQSQFDKR